MGSNISAVYVVVVALTTNSDIGHVDFLEMVYKQAERPYVIVGLHFDQVQLLKDVHAHSHLSNNIYTDGRGIHPSLLCRWFLRKTFGS